MVSGRSCMRKEKQAMIRQALWHEGQESDEEEEEEDYEQHLTEASQCTLVNISVGKASRLTRNQKRARRDILGYTAGMFCELSGIKVNEEWPTWVDGEVDERINEATGQSYMTPNFTFGVKHPGNAQFLGRITDTVLQNLNLNGSDRPEWADDPSFKIRRTHVLALAKVSWGGFKLAWRKQQSVEAIIEGLQGAWNSHCALRRKLVSTHSIAKALDIAYRFLLYEQKVEHHRTYTSEYERLHGDDPTPFIHTDHMSDEASGPEGFLDEDAALEWRLRMARALNHTNPTCESIEHLEVFKVI
ncbi:hypothetical protein EWM64_g7078 [Hericium alpestre]|uniref:Uncharacterized protein n=1 Tax=Hericium alpestre TaxID=135208 RepID=A0A4Y9ZSB4_9AGAM|nr:hypothetical protein EWM64_g7078 [Hericium alpestre]